MKSNRRQTLPFFVVLLMVASVFAFTTVSAASSIVATVDADNGSYSFASVNGSAEYTVTITNDGDVDFEEVEISASFVDETWHSENVTFSVSGNEGNGSFLLGPLVSSAVIQVQVSVNVGLGVKIDYPEVPMEIQINAQDDGGEDASVGLGVIVGVTNWIAYEANFPDKPAVQTYEVGDEHTYQITVENIAVTKNPDNTTVSMPIRDVITIQYLGMGGGWWITSDDEGWDPMYGGVLNGMNASTSHTWNVTVNLTGDVKAGDHVIDFQAQSTDPDDPFGGMPYIQPYGMTDIPVSAAETYGVSVSGAGSRSVDISEGPAIATWNIVVKNLGNTEDTFSISWDDSGVPSDWILSNRPGTSGKLAWKASSPFDVYLTAPADALAGSSASFSMTATTFSSPFVAASQTFVATVDQYYGVSLNLECGDNPPEPCPDSKSKAPGGAVDFIFKVTNDGNGDDTFDVAVEGPSVWMPTASVTDIALSAVSSGQFTVSVTIPEDRDAGAESGNITVTVSSSDGESTDFEIVSVSTSQVYNVSLAYASGSDGTIIVTQETQLQLKLNITNNGNGIDTIALSMANEPSWATLGVDSVQIGRGQTISIVITLSPDTAALSGRDYTFQVVATSEDDSETIGPDLTAQIEVKETEGEEIVIEELEEENDEGGLPGFGVFASLLALTFIVLSRRKD